MFYGVVSRRKNAIELRIHDVKIGQRKLDMLPLRKKMYDELQEKLKKKKKYVWKYNELGSESSNNISHYKPLEKKKLFLPKYKFQIIMKVYSKM